MKTINSFLMLARNLSLLLGFLLLPSFMQAQSVCASAALSTGYEEIFNVTFGALNNSSDCNTIVSGGGSIALRYSNYQSLTPVTVAKTIAIPFSVEIGSCNPNGVYPNRVAVFIDLNHNNSFNDSGELVYSSLSATTGPHTEYGQITIPVTALNGNTVLRIISSEQSSAINNPCLSYGWGETEDYTINIVDPTACTGSIALGNTTASSTKVCAGSSINFGVQYPPINSSVALQWYKNGLAIAGATNATYVAGINTAAAFSCKATCLATGSVSFSTAINVTISSFLDCYCVSAAASSGDEGIMNFTLNGSSTPAAYAGVNACTVIAPGPGSKLNAYSNFITLGSLATIHKGSSIPFSIQIDDCDGAPYYGSGTAMWIDYNHNGVFTDPGEKIFSTSALTVSPSTINDSFIPPLTALTGNTVLRITTAEGIAGSSVLPCMAYGFGETEDYLINIDIPLINANLALQCLIEAYWETTNMRPVLSNQLQPASSNACDSIDVELRHPLTFALIASSKTVLAQNGIANCVFNNITSGNYYIAVKHRNAIETWSALPVPISASCSYNFTSSADKAYGSNQTEIASGVWAFYSGDAVKNMSESIDLIDLAALETDISNFESGYFSTDINGDGNVDIIDAAAMEKNITNFIFSNHL